jgi:large subunit ribosomal protein L18e
VRKVRTTNPQLIELINFLRKQSSENKVEVWWDIAERLAKPRRRGTAVNLSRLNRYTKKRETVAVPGKVLSTGKMDHPITIAAFAFSAKAREKIGAARGKCLSFSELVKKNPKGFNVKVIG